MSRLLLPSCLGAVVVWVLVFCTPLFAERALQDKPYTENQHKKKVRKDIVYDYLVKLPDGYHKEAETRWPLILWLHGGGGKPKAERVYNGLSKITELPAIIVIPICPTPEEQGVHPHHNAFDYHILGEIVTVVSQQYRVDPAKRSVIGFSAGATGAWLMPFYNKKMFSKVVVIAGVATPWAILNYPKDVQVWVFIGEKDRLAIEQQNTVDSAKRFKIDVVRTLMRGVDHGKARTRAMEHPNIAKWLVSDKDLRDGTDMKAPGE
jgi:predicted peptidase